MRTRLVAWTALMAAAGLAQDLAVKPMRLSARDTETFQKALHKDLPSRKFAMAAPAEKRLAPLAASELQPDPAALAAMAGVHRGLEGSVEAFGRWTVAGPDKVVWRYRVQSPGAAGLRVHFRNFAAGKGRVWIHDGSENPEISGPYTGKGLFGDGDFWSDFVLTDTIVVEYEPEQMPDSLTAPPPFEIAGLSHLLPGIVRVAPEGNEAQAGAVAPQAAASCHLDFSCYPEWRQIGAGVGHMVYEKEGRTYVCSGTLLADRNRTGTPFFLTADHCIDSAASARSLQVFWFYQSSTCNGPPADRRSIPRSLGSTLLFNSGMAQGDVTLLRLNSIPDGVTFAAWNAEEHPIGSRFTGIHHPSGDYKRISFAERVPALPGLAGTDPNYFYSVRTYEGKTEGGSSGSGLFNGNGELVGTLTWGPKLDLPDEACRRNPFYNGYGRFSTHYAFLRDFLEGRTTTPNPNPTPPAGGAGVELPLGQPRNVTFPAVTGATLFSGDSTLRVRVPTGTTRLELRLNTNGQAGFIARWGQPPTVEAGRAVGDYTSPGFTGSEVLVLTPQSNPPLVAGDLYLAVAVFELNREVSGTISATATTGGGGGTTPPPTGGGNVLVSGQRRSFSLPAASAGTLFNGDRGYRIDVPQGALRLEVQLSGPANVDLDLFVRFGQDVVVQNRSVVADHTSEGRASSETIVITPSSTPVLRAGTYYIAVATFTTGIAADATVVATVSGAPPPSNPNPTTPPPSGSGTQLAPGQARNFRLAPVGFPTLVGGNQGYYVQVPEGARSLTLALATTTPGVDVDLLVRYNTPPSVTGGRIESDYDSSGPTGNERVSITATSTPPLRAGIYYVALAVFSKNVEIDGTLTATVETGSSTPPAGDRQLRSGADVRFDVAPLTGATLLNGDRSYILEVPDGATRVAIRLNTTNPAHDVDLYVRRGSDNVVSAGKVTSDYSSTGPAGQEQVVFDGASNPPLRPGTYYVSLAVFETGVNVSGTLRAEITGGSTTPPPGGSDPRGLISGSPARFSFDAVSGPTLMRGQRGFFLDVPQNATRVDITLNTATPGADLDLYVRHGEDIGISEGRPVADFLAEGATGAETISITPGTDPALRAGRYFIGIGIFTEGTPTQGTVTAVISTQGSTAPRGDNMLVPGTPSKFTLPAVDSPTLFLGEYGYRMVVPEGVTKVTLRLLADSPNVDIDLYARFEQDVDLDDDGRPVADFVAEREAGDETIVMSDRTSPVLRPGTYYIAFGSFTAGTPIAATLTAQFERESIVPPLSSARPLTSGQPVAFTLPAVEQSAFFGGQGAFRIAVPAGAARLEVDLMAENPDHDVDLFVRHGREAELQNGRIVADIASTSQTGNERVVVDNPRAGEYFINLALFTTGTPVRISALRATVIPGEQSSVFRKEAGGEDFASGDAIAPKAGVLRVEDVTLEAKSPAAVAFGAELSEEDSRPGKPKRLARQEQ